MLEFLSHPVFSKKVQYLAATKHPRQRSSPLRLLALKPDLFRSHYDLGLWQGLVYNCMYLHNSSLSLSHSLFIEILLTKLDCSYIGISIDSNFPTDSETPKPNLYQRTPCTHPIFWIIYLKMIIFNIYICIYICIYTY